MAFQWYQWDPGKNRMVWTETETPEPPGAGWTSSDVPLFDSDQLRPELRSGETWTVRGEATWDPPAAVGLFQGLPKGEPWEYRRPRLVEPAATERPDREYAQEMAQWYRKRYPDRDLLGRSSQADRLRRTGAEVFDYLQRYEVLPLSMLAVPTYRPSMRRWWRTVHRLSSATTVPRARPQRSAPRVAGRRRGRR